MRRGMLAAAALAWLAACGGGDGGPANVTRTCDLPADGFCTQMTGPAVVLDEGTLAGFCAESGGTWGAPCATVGWVGRCDEVTEQGGLSVALVGYYYGPAFTTETARLDCTGGGGTFTAP